MRKRALQKRRKESVSFSSLKEEAEEPLLREMIEMKLKMWALMTLGLNQECGSFTLERRQKE
jgi:hypothetical protein